MPAGADGRECGQMKGVLRVGDSQFEQAKDFGGVGKIDHGVSPSGKTGDAGDKASVWTVMQMLSPGGRGRLN